MGAIGTLTLTLDQVKHLVFGACGSKFGTVASAGSWNEDLVSRAIEDIRTPTLTVPCVKDLWLLAGCDLGASTLALDVIKLLGRCASLFRSWTFTVACVGVESLSTETVQFPCTLAPTGFIVEDLIGEGTLLWSVGTFTLTANVVKHLSRRAFRLGLRAFTLTSLCIEFLAPRTCKQLLRALALAGVLVEKNCG